MATSIDMGDTKTQYNNHRLNTDVGLSCGKQRDLSPLFYNTIKHLQILKSGNNLNTTSKNNNSLYSYLKNSKKKSGNKLNFNKSNNTSGNSGNYEACLTEPEKHVLNTEESGNDNKIIYLRFVRIKYVTTWKVLEQCLALNRDSR